jgi:ABC-type antimicrobial peptide transport system permease subunit
MFHLKIIIRTLFRNRLYSWINIGGLAISLTAVILIMLWVSDELSFDRFHRNADRIYRVTSHVPQYDMYFSAMPAAFASAAAAEIPGIERISRIRQYSYSNYWEYDNNKFYALKGAAVDKSFLEMFDFNLIKGNIKGVFDNDLSMIISETQAGILFGDEDPIGKIVKSGSLGGPESDLLFQITGVMQDMPQNTMFLYDYFIPFAAQQRTVTWRIIEEDWGNSDYQTFFQLGENVDAALVAGNIGKMITRLRGEQATAEYALQPLSKIHLFQVGGQPEGMKTVRLFGVIAIFILTIACINYVNLITARATKRSKEVSLRKILGGGRISIMWHLMFETLLLYVAALTISTLFIDFLFPSFNAVAGKKMVFSLSDPSVLWVYGITTAAVILFAGLYPAIQLSSFKPLEAFRGGAMGKGNHGYLRKTLVVLQFVFSFGLIVSTVVIGSQLHYMRTMDLGYNMENVFTMESKDLNKRFDVVKNELMKNTDILSVAGSEGVRMKNYGSRTGTNWEGKDPSPDYNPRIHTNRITHDFLQLMNIQLASGEYFAENDQNYVIINEEAVKVMGLDEPLGKRFWMNKSDEENFIIKGVVKDYHFETLNEPVKPLVLLLTDQPYSLYVKTAAGGAKSAIASLETLWKQYNANFAFNYYFMDDEFDRVYKADLRTGMLLNIFAFIAIFVSCLGLFGLITYTAETKTKEIGIRKVLGASVSNIVTMLSKEFLILVGIAMLIAIPLAYYLLDKMLQDYAYRISISWWMFALAGIFTILLTLITVGWQAVKAATANPVKSIKSE